MSQTKVQLVGNVVSDVVFSGIVTATSVNVGGSVGINSEGINTSGIITATSFVGDGSGLTGVGIGSEGSINTSGIITASKASSSEFVGTGDKLIFSPSPTSFNPIDGSTSVGLNTSITITFDQLIYAGVGTITLRNSSGIGTIIQSIGIGSTLISGQTLTISPTSLPINTDVYVVLPQGVVTNAVGGGNNALNTYNFTTIDFQLSSINPTNGATNVGLDTNITLTFTSPPTRGTGTIELRSGSTSGTIVESFDAAASGRISVSGNNWILDPTSNLNYNTTIYPIIPSTAIQNYVGLNTTGASSYSFTTRDIALGEVYEGGFLICQAGGVRWIVAPRSSEVSRTWHSRYDAITRAQQVSGCNDWFVPDCGQYKNPGHVCRNYWDYSLELYWSTTELNPTCAWTVMIRYGNGYCRNKGSLYCVRSFRCVTY